VFFAGSAGNNTLLAAVGVLILKQNSESIALNVENTNAARLDGANSKWDWTSSCRIGQAMDDITDMFHNALCSLLYLASYVVPPGCVVLLVVYYLVPVVASQSTTSY